MPLPLRIAALDHEFRHHPVEGQAVVELDSRRLVRIFGPFDQADEIDHRQRDLLEFELHGDLAFGGVDIRVKAGRQGALGHGPGPRLFWMA